MEVLQISNGGFKSPRGRNIASRQLQRVSYRFSLPPHSNGGFRARGHVTGYRLALQAGSRGVRLPLAPPIVSEWEEYD